MRATQFFATLLTSVLISTAQAGICPDTLNVTAKRLQDDQPVSLCAYAGQVILVVNTASQCGYTGQYEGLERLYRQHRQDGFVVLGFPSNDFGGQEPGSSKQIADFCKNMFDVQFPLFSKTPVTGPQAHPLFRSLSQSTGQMPRWNFHKYLIGRDGRVLSSFPSQTDPSSPQLTQAIRTAIATKP